MGLLSLLTRDEPGSDPAIDALAEIVRVFGRHGIPLDGLTAEDFAERCETWARHLLFGSPPPNVVAPKAKKAFTDLVRFFADRRDAEHRYTQVAVSELNGVLQEVVARLRGALDDGDREDQAINKELGSLASAAAVVDPAELRARVARSVGVVAARLEARKKERDLHLERLGKRLEELESDLETARTQGATDPLTGLQNRGAFDTELPRQIKRAERTSEALSLLLVDLDHFKVINDTHGHPAGDRVLRAVADNLVRAFPRKSDFLARYGGEELVLVLPNTKVADAARLAERFLAALRNDQIGIEGGFVQVTASIGISQWSRGESPEQVLARADKALYDAKKSGRDRVMLGG